MRFKVTVTEVRTDIAATESVQPLTVVFEQTIDDLNLRTFVRQLNAAPRRRKATAPATAKKA